MTVLILSMITVALPLTRATALCQSQAVWSVRCEVSHRAPDDPIVFPAQAGRSHMHDFFGNVSTDADSSTASLVNAGSSCLKGMDAVDRAAYWTPSLMQGNAVVAGVPGEQRIDAYYAVLDKRTSLRPIPFGLRMIAGDAKATGPQPLNIVHYNCLRYPNGGQVAKPSASIPTCPGSSYLSAKITSPAAGTARTSTARPQVAHGLSGAGGLPDHTPGRPAVGRHPCPLEDGAGVPSSRLSLSSGGQFSMHADFWNVWNPAVMEWLVSHCLNQTQNCTDIARSEITATGAFPSGDDPSLGSSTGSSSGTGQQSAVATKPAGSGQPSSGEQSVRAACPRSSFESRRAQRKCRQAIGEALVQQAGGP